MVKTFIFDIGNVLFEFTPIKMVKSVIGEHIDANYLAKIIFDRKYWDKLDLDEITIEDEKEDLKNMLPPHLYPLACQILDNWLNEITPIEGIEELLSLLKERGFKLYYLSNICSQFLDERYKYSHIKRILDFFDGGVISGPLHIVKPNRYIYEHLLKKYSIKIDDALYIDDSQKNIDAGKNIGLLTYLFDGDVDKLRHYIEKNTLAINKKCK